MATLPSVRTNSARMRCDVFAPEHEMFRAQVRHDVRARAYPRRGSSRRFASPRRKIVRTPVLCQNAVDAKPLRNRVVDLTSTAATRIYYRTLTPS